VIAMSKRCTISRVENGTGMGDDVCKEQFKDSGIDDQYSITPVLHTLYPALADDFAYQHLLIAFGAQSQEMVRSSLA